MKTLSMQTNMIIITLWDIEVKESNAGNLYSLPIVTGSCENNLCALEKDHLKQCMEKIKIRDTKFVLSFLVVACENVFCIKVMKEIQIHTNMQIHC